VTAVESPAAADQERSDDLRMVARGGSLNFIGALANGLLQFAMVVVVTRALTRSASGAFFEAVALFLILFVWQLPHFIAISLFRAEEYRAAGLKIGWTAVDPGPRTRPDAIAPCKARVTASWPTRSAKVCDRYLR